MKKLSKTEVSLSLIPGHRIAFMAESPVIEFIHGGLWVGNSPPSSGWCFGTFSGPAALRKLALAILAEHGTGPKKKRKKA